jgi:hypothetical protein
MGTRPFRTVTRVVGITRFLSGGFLIGGITCAALTADAQNLPGQPPLGVFREANKPQGSGAPQQSQPNSQPKSPPRAAQPIEAPLGNPQWQPKNPASGAPQGNTAPSAPGPSIPDSSLPAPRNPGRANGSTTGEWGANVPPSNDFKPPVRGGGVFGVHMIPEPPVQEPPSEGGGGLGSIGGIIPGFASSNGFGGSSGLLGGGGLGGAAGGLGGGGLGGGALGGALLGCGIQGLFSGLNPSSIMQIAVGAGMLLSQMNQQQGQGDTSQNRPTPTPSPTIRP